ncbi:MAG TPA: hypothetical protein VIY08_06875 [Candidatus Nitrosocosmicus sp.]
MDYNHTRIIQVRFQLIENKVRDMINKLNETDSDSLFILYSIKYDIDEENKKKLLESLKKILDEINLVKENFNLELEEQSFFKSIAADLDQIFLTLDDTKPESLVKGYGAIPKSDQKLLKNHVSKLLDITDKVSIEIGHTKKQI